MGASVMLAFGATGKAQPSLAKCQYLCLKCPVVWWMTVIPLHRGSFSNSCFSGNDSLRRNGASTLDTGFIFAGTE